MLVGTQKLIAPGDYVHQPVLGFLPITAKQICFLIFLHQPCVHNEKVLFDDFWMFLIILILWMQAQEVEIPNRSSNKL